MEFLDEESRPRFLFLSRTISKPSSGSANHSPLRDLHKPTLFVSLFIGILFFFLSLFYFQSDPLSSIFLWFTLSLFVGPFAPPSLTGGDIRVGLGPALQPQPISPEETLERDPPKRSRFRIKKPDQENQDSILNLIQGVVVEEPLKPRKGNDPIENGKGKDWVFEEEKEWSEIDLDLLKKQMVKYPVGMPGRWEAVSEAFSGRHKVDSVVKMAKGMGDRKATDSDSFSRFLKDRKPVDKRIDEVIESERTTGGSWSSTEDIALLNALKAFPKEVSMRWEKITAAVPGRSKAACMKRVADLKRDFRSSKASVEV